MLIYSDFALECNPYTSCIKKTIQGYHYRTRGIISWREMEEAHNFPFQYGSIKNAHQEVIYECKWEHQGIVHSSWETFYSISYRRNVHIEKTLYHWKCIVAMSWIFSELDKIKFESTLSLGEHSPKLSNNFSNNPDLVLIFSITSSFFKELSKAKDKYPDFKYIDISNSQLQSFQIKFTERSENRLSSKTIKVLLSNTKLTGRKRIAFDSNVDKIVIFADVLENVKQLNFSLQMSERVNIEFEKSVLIYIIVYRKKYVLRGLC